MIISHKYKFIFIKTRRTGTSSFEAEVFPYLGKNDIMTGVYHMGKNTKGYFNPIPDLKWWLKYKYLCGPECILKNFLWCVRYYNHIPAEVVRSRVGRKIWEDYFKFTIERNPFEKEVSLYLHHKYVYNRKKYTFDDFMKEDDHCLNYPIYTIDGEVAVDYVCRFSRLEKDLKYVAKKVGFPFEGLKHKISQHSATPNEKREALELAYTKYRDKIREIFKKEYEIWGDGLDKF